MNKEILASLLILAGYIYGTTIYDPWYFVIQGWLVKLELLKVPENAPENIRLLGNKVQIVAVSVVAIGIGIWLFILGNG